MSTAPLSWAHKKLKGTVDVDLDATTGLDLKNLLLPSLPDDLTLDTIKLLCGGRILKDSPTLSAQKVTPTKTIKVMKTASKASKASTKQEQASHEALARVFEAAQELANRHDDGGELDQRQFLELQDANTGRTITLPEDDNRALVLGLTLQEKGKRYLDDNQLDIALEFFTKAEQAFLQCDPQYSMMTDNYGCLCLDICWLYMKLGDPSFLDQAQAKLDLVVDNFSNVHGPNLERLVNLRGGFCPEMALYVRLHLLQGALAWFRGDATSARMFFNLTQQELASLQLDDDKLLQLYNMGFSETEARRALRATSNNVDNAATFALQKREQEAQHRRQQRERIQKRKQQLRLGKTSNGSLVDLDLLYQINSMGFDYDLAAEALKQTDNDLDASINLVASQPDVLLAAMNDTSLSNSDDTADEESTPEQDYIQHMTDGVNEGHLATLADMGFDPEAAHRALQATQGDLDAASALLSEKPDFAAGLSTMMSSFAQQYPTASDDQPEPPSTPNIDIDDIMEGLQEANTLAGMTPEQRAEQERRQQLDDVIENELLDDLDDDADAYLDLDLQDETKMLNDFLDKLAAHEAEAEQQHST